MKRSILALIIIGTAFTASVAHADAKLDELVRKADMVTRSKTSAAVFEMTIKTSTYTRSFKIVAWDDRRHGEKSLIKILGPALWRGYGTLKIDSQLKMYNPKSNHVTLVGSSMLGDSWMGSHFTNDDLVKETQLQKHFTSRIIETHKGELGSLGSGTFYRLRLDPKPTAPVAWGKIVYELWEGGPIVVPVRATYFRKVSDKKPTRTMSFSEMKKMSGRTMPCVMSITVTDKPGEYTKITYRKVKFDIAIPGAKFTEQALRN
ncbi:MAG: outer membrane lipoprotein-sorting protein [Myxococcales bacterium]|nr:outer membrane lipoprotein-sorting protein [Myxococcales bacterium]